MCLLPKLNPIKKKTQTIAAFKGLNERSVIEDGEFSDCCNVSSKEYPAVSVMDGYSDYANSIGYALPNMYVKAKNNIMMFNNEDFAGNHTVTAYIMSSNSFGNSVTSKSIFSGSSGAYRLHDFCLYNGNLVVLLSIYDATREMWHMRIDDYQDNEVSIALNGIFGENCGFSAGMISFGSRLIALDGAQIHISYFNDISAAKWTTYNEDGVENEKCAKQIELLDDGDFTGCINYRDYPIFFKKNSMYMLLGEYTSTFSLTRIDSVGCHFPNTISICNGKLYFLSKLGVMEYDGGIPQLISQNIDLDVYDKSNKYGCSDDRYYCIGKYVYDTYTKIWSKQRTNLSVVQPQCYFNGNLYVADSTWVDPEEENAYELVGISKTDPSILSDWNFTTKQFHEYQDGKKIISKLSIGFENISATALKIEVSLDKGTFKTVYTWDGTTNFAKEVPILLPPCDYFQIKVSGTGKMIVHYIKREFRVLGA